MKDWIFPIVLISLCFVLLLVYWLLQIDFSAEHNQINSWLSTSLKNARLVDILIIGMVISVLNHMFLKK